MSESETDMEFLDGLIGRPITVSDRVRLFALARRGAAVAETKDDQFTRIQRLDTEVCVLRAAMLKVTEALNQGRIVPRAAVSGMTIDAQLRNSVYTGVPCGPIEDAIEMLDEAGLRMPLPPPPEGEK